MVILLIFKIAMKKLVNKKKKKQESIGENNSGFPYYLSKKKSKLNKNWTLLILNWVSTFHVQLRRRSRIDNF